MKPSRHPYQHAEQGAAAVEFAIVAGVVFMLLIGIMEMGRVLFYWNTATEATRLGARLAIVCDLHDSAIKAKMVSLFPTLSPGDISLAYQPAGCTVTDCQQVTVSIAPGKVITTYIPYVSMALTLPEFATTLSRESMQSTFNGTANPVCM